jgi:hypothetical protein
LWNKKNRKDAKQQAISGLVDDDAPNVHAKDTTFYMQISDKLIREEVAKEREWRFQCRSHRSRYFTASAYADVPDA